VEQHVAAVPSLGGHWARQGILQVKRWLPNRLLIIVADSTFSAIELIAVAGQQTSRPSFRRSIGCAGALPSRARVVADRGLIVSGAAPPPCNARFDRQDANQLGQIGSHIWLTI